MFCRGVCCTEGLLHSLRWLEYFTLMRRLVNADKEAWTLLESSCLETWVIRSGCFEISHVAVWFSLEIGKRPCSPRDLGHLLSKLFETRSRFDCFEGASRFFVRTEEDKICRRFLRTLLAVAIVISWKKAISHAASATPKTSLGCWQVRNSIQPSSCHCRCVGKSHQLLQVPECGKTASEYGQVTSIVDDDGRRLLTPGAPACKISGR